MHAISKEHSKMNPVDLESLLETAKVPLFQLCFIPKTGSLSIDYCSPEVSKIFEIEGARKEQNIFQFINRSHEDDRIRIIQNFESLLESPEFWTLDFRIILPKKGLRFIQAKSDVSLLENGNYIFRGNLSDVTDQKLVAEELKEKRERLYMALENSRKGVWDWNVSTDEVFYSKESLNIIGYSEEEFKKSATAWNDLVYPDDREKYYKDIEEHFSGATSLYNSEHRIRTKNGDLKWIQDIGKIIETDNNGNPSRVIGTHFDITDQKIREQAISKTIVTVEAQNARLLNFAHIVSHNLRSHSGNFETILEMMSGTENIDEKLENIVYLEKISQSLSETIVHLNEIVSANAKSNNKLEKLNLSKFIENTRLALFSDIHNNQATVVNKVGEDLSIMYNAAYLESILLNFISNGIKYSHEDRSPEIQLFTQLENGKLVLIIKDNGKGIDLEKFGKRIFGMYQTFHGNEDANGIGLFITKNQIETMGGSVTVESTVGVGTTFKIYFNEATTQSS